MHHLREELLSREVLLGRGGERRAEKWEEPSKRRKESRVWGPVGECPPPRKRRRKITQGRHTETEPDLRLTSTHCELFCFLSECRSFRKKMSYAPFFSHLNNDCTTNLSIVE